MHSFALGYEHIIDWIVGACPGPDKFAHTYAGLAIWLGAAVLFRKPLRLPMPLAVVIVLELLNECVDRIAHGGWMWHDTLGDTAATWVWPTVLTVG